MKVTKEMLGKVRYYFVEDDAWWDFVYEEFKGDMHEKGIEVSNLFFSSFYSQGDGACFEGHIRDDATFCTVHGLYETYPILKQYNELGGILDVGCAQRGLHTHEYSVMFDFEMEPFYKIMGGDDLEQAVAEQLDEVLDQRRDDIEEDVKEIFRGHMRDLYRCLRDEYESRISDEYLTEMFNEGMFDHLIDEFQVAA